MGGWILPLIPVIVALSIDRLESMSEYAPQYGLPQCWFNSEYGLFLYFLLPVAIAVVANIVSYTIVITRFAVLAYQTRKSKTSHGEKLILGVKLFFAFGLLWVIGLLAAIFNKSKSWSCIFMFVNSLSGVLLMLVFVCNGAIFKALRYRITGKGLRQVSTKSTTRLKTYFSSIKSSN